jgi:two-component system, chemotaxis family, chemotaxis protein CheY
MLISHIIQLIWELGAPAGVRLYSSFFEKNGRHRLMSNEINILVVDDLPNIRRIIRAVLKELRCTNVDDADGVEMALALLRKGNYGLVIADWKLPQLDGLSLLRSIRSDSKLAHLSVLLMTGMAKKENIATAVQAGADGIVIKPFTLGAFEDSLRKILGKARSMNAAAQLAVNDAVTERPTKVVFEAI